MGFFFGFKRLLVQECARPLEPPDWWIGLASVYPTPVVFSKHHASSGASYPSVPLQQAVSRPIFDWQAMGRLYTQLIPSSERCLLVSIHFMVVTYQENGVTQYARLSHRSHMLAPDIVPA